MPELREHLQNLFGLDDFRPSQREVIEDVLAGRDVLCVMPTGAGKSLCYQLPTSVQGGLTVVVSPLISLMADQVQQLRDEGLPAMLINSSQNAAEQREALALLHQGFEGLLYVAPERFASASFMANLEKLPVKLFAIDEAHCISQWGHDFRPDYFQLGEVREQLGSPPTIALTATATDDVRGDIIQKLALREPSIVVTGFDRPNLAYESQRISKNIDKDRLLIDLLRRETGTGIVYCSTRKNVDQVTTMLSENLADRPVFAYHAGMDQAARASNQERFMTTPRSIAVATNAFGMGINKPDIRFVVHYNIPGTLEAYYQEAGRAGRDGQISRCIVLFSFQDRYTQEFFIDKIGQEGNLDEKVREDLQERARAKLELLIKYAQTSRCRRQMILDYFGDEAEVTNCHCDVCRRGEISAGDAPVVMPDEVTTLVRQLLSAIARLNGRFGVGVVGEVLTGTTNEKTTRWGFDRLTVFGLLRIYSVKRVIAMLHRLIEAGLARQRDPDRNFRPIVELTPAGIAVMKGEQLPPAPLIDLLPRNSRSAVTSSRPRAEKLGVVEIEDEQLDPETLARFERLRHARMELARDRQLPPYCICHDRTLKLIARHAPRDRETLEQIKGMGPHKVRMYGERLLSAIEG